MVGVTSNNVACSKIGRDVLKEGGNAIDAAIASTFCLAMAEPHITGIGGGGFMLIHQHRRNFSTVIDFRESASFNDRRFRYLNLLMRRPVTISILFPPPTGIFKNNP